MRRIYGLFAAVGLCGWVALAVILCVIPSADAAPPTVNDLVNSDRATLDALFAGGSVGGIPTGFLPGRTIPKPGEPSNERRSKRLGLLWQGKVFNADGTGRNKVFGVQAIPINIYQGESLRDGGPAIIVDYSNSWRIFRGVRDEIREVSPGVYLGLTYVTKKGCPEVSMRFALEAPAVNCNCGR